MVVYSIDYLAPTIKALTASNTEISPLNWSGFSKISIHYSYTVIISPNYSAVKHSGFSTSSVSYPKAFSKEKLLLK